MIVKGFCVLALPQFSLLGIGRGERLKGLSPSEGFVPLSFGGGGVLPASSPKRSAPRGTTRSAPTPGPRLANADEK